MRTPSKARRRIAALLASTALACGLLLTGGATAAASADPYASSGYNGANAFYSGCQTDPASYRVGPAATVHNHKGEEIGLVELWYSPMCGTNWTQITREDGQWYEPMRAVILRPYDQWWYDANNTYDQFYFISPMLYAPTTCAIAYGHIDQADDDSGDVSTGCY